MVNKQYNVQNLKKSKNRSPPPRRNSLDVSDIPNPPNINNLDTISEERNGPNSLSGSIYGRNISYMHRDHEFDVCDENCEKLNHREVSINDIGRFQYILQMDKEMETQANRFYNLNPPEQIAFSPYSSANSVNSNNHINFWKAGSQSPITITSSCRSHRQRLFKYLRIFWKYSKWPIALLLVCGLLAMIIYFLVIETNFTENSPQNQPILNFKSHENSIGIRTSSVLPFPNSRDDLPDRTFTTLNISTGLPIQIGSNASRNNVGFTNPIFTDNTKLSSITTTSAGSTGVSKPFTTTQRSESSSSRNTQILEISTSKMKIPDWIPVNEENTNDSDDDSKLMFPTKETLEFFGFTSGHQNNFGIPIEEDERILRMLNEQLIKNEKNKNYSDIMVTTTDSNTYRTRVSPTLPILQNIEATTEYQRNATTMDDEICQSTSMPMCRGILPYDLTTSKRRISYTSVEMQHFEYLVASKCSLRSHEFICSVLEPECRPKQMGALLPCKRVCKSILEPCGHIIAASEILTLSFDCDSYPDSNDPTVCRDITRNKKCFQNEFQCNDFTCIPSQWKCDNIKDCAAAEDEENCKFCEQDEFRCTGTDKCIPDKWRCDQYEDCPGATDELDCFDEDDRTFAPLLFGNNKFFTSENVPIQSTSRPYLTISGDDRLNLADSNERKRQIFSTTESDRVYLTNADPKVVPTTGKAAKNTERDEFQVAASGITVPFSKTLANFQDSKEIMMTSDSEADYKYSSSDIVTAKTSHSSPCPEGELRCINGQCITISQLCDKITDCPDGADEAMCVFKN